jgi:hypothetical protein
LYAHYLSSQADRPPHPGEEDILRAQHNDGERVVEEVLLGEFGKPVLFHKNMAHHLVDLEWGFLNRLTNVLLTRQPRDMLHSYSKTIPEFGLADTGYDKLKRIADGIIAAGQAPIVIDSKRLLESPESVLRIYVKRWVSISFPRCFHGKPDPKRTTVSGHPIGITMPTGLPVLLPTNQNQNLFLSG